MLVRENDYIYITELKNQNDVVWYQATFKTLSICRISKNIDKLEKEFTEYAKELIARFNK